ncbi:phage tail sheath family protein [Pedobacter polysacchareus]|uniref:phage tail sheath family protein n=1 Tax=Pedobacter polysacchareus TaxID=2861973 RepID=UPI001C995378|nr:phage tail sheath C-terminal domain-containing protein [Pedobacter polysacchareus]
MENYQTPGVYIVDNVFSNSVVEVETAIPAFIGYTFKAERDGKSLLRVPTKIDSFAEYVESFGAAFKPKFTVTKEVPKPAPSKGQLNADEPRKEKRIQKVQLGKQNYLLSYADDHELYFYNSIRLFYANGGGSCVILSVGTYGDPEGTNGETLPKKVLETDFMAAKDQEGPLDILKKDHESTLIVIPDIIALGKKAYPIYRTVLAHCAETQRRFGVFDLRNHQPDEQPDQVAEEFRADIDINFLNYGAAYYPWLQTSIVDENELTFENFSDDLSSVFEPMLKEISDQYEEQKIKLQVTIDSLSRSISLNSKGENAKLEQEVSEKIMALNQAKVVFSDLKKQYHLKLKSSSPYYRFLLEQGRMLFNELPPSAAIVGLYAMVDHTRGVWKAPANLSLNSVNSPTVIMTSEAQESFNIDALSGKSINVIRRFQGLGTLVWGARTLDGNSQDWKYIQVRRTLMMIEQSIKAAAKSYVFEPNDNNTWITVKSVVNNFLTNLWKQGALAGASPEQAFEVQIGLGSTMTATDILDGKMIITVKVAIVRPAEFIILTFLQQMQPS